MVSRRPGGWPSDARMAVNKCDTRGPFGAWINAAGMVEYVADGVSGIRVPDRNRRAIAVLPLLLILATYCAIPAWRIRTDPLRAPPALRHTGGSRKALASPRRLACRDRAT